jgi:transcriptional regulator with XRE-family HTH domain
LHSLGRAIREIREQRGMGAGDLAAAAGVALEEIVALESGRLDPDLDMLLALADALEVPSATVALRAQALADTRELG